MLPWTDESALNLLMLGILTFDMCMELTWLIFAEMNNPPCLTFTDQTNVPRVPCEFKP